jgi:hypothetical protein
LLAASLPTFQKLVATFFSAGTVAQRWRGENASKNRRIKLSAVRFVS